MFSNTNVTNILFQIDENLRNNKSIVELYNDCQNSQEEKNRGCANCNHYVCNAIYQVKNLIENEQILNIID